MTGYAGHFVELGARRARVPLAARRRRTLRIWLNLSPREVAVAAPPAGALVSCEPAGAEHALAERRLPPCSAACFLEAADGR